MNRIIEEQTFRSKTYQRNSMRQHQCDEEINGRASSQIIIPYTLVLYSTPAVTLCLPHTINSKENYNCKRMI